MPHDGHHHETDPSAEDAPRPLIVAVTSQNFRSVTAHAGKTRRFLLFSVTGDTIRAEGRFDLPKTMALHGWRKDKPHPIFAVDVLLAGSAGAPFRGRMAREGVHCEVVGEGAPAEEAVAAWVADGGPARLADTMQSAAE